jgi:hypothetical protein
MSVRLEVLNELGKKLFAKMMVRSSLKLASQQYRPMNITVVNGDNRRA